MRYHPGNLRNADSVGESLRSLSAKVPSAELRTSLRVLASRERQRRLEHRNLAAILHTWRENTQLFLDNVVLSLALPFAGGVFSTVVLFSMFVVPAYPLLSNSDADVPTILNTPVAVKSIAPTASPPISKRFIIPPDHGPPNERPADGSVQKSAESLELHN